MARKATKDQSAFSFDEPMPEPVPDKPQAKIEVYAVTTFWQGFTHVACYCKEHGLVMGRRCKKDEVARTIMENLPSHFVWRGKVESCYEWTSPESKYNDQEEVI